MIVFIGKQLLKMRYILKKLQCFNIIVEMGLLLLTYKNTDKDRIKIYVRFILKSYYGFGINIKGRIMIWIMVYIAFILFYKLIIFFINF